MNDKQGIYATNSVWWGGVTCKGAKIVKCYEKSLGKSAKCKYNRQKIRICVVIGREASSQCKKVKGKTS